MTTSIRLPRSAACHSRLNAGSGRPFNKRNDTCGKLAPDNTRAVKFSGSPSTNRMRRSGTIRITTLSIAAVTATIQIANRSFSSESMGYQLLSKLRRRSRLEADLVLPRQNAIGVFVAAERDHHLRPGPL